jgi:uncharacterized membrane protein
VTSLLPQGGNDVFQKSAMNQLVHAVVIFASLLLSWLSSHHHHLTVYETWHTIAEIQVHRSHRKVATGSKRAIE